MKRCWIWHDWFVPSDVHRECSRCGKYQVWGSYDKCWFTVPRPGSKLVWTIDGPEYVYEKKP